MIAINIEKTENTIGGGFVDGLCVGIGAGSILYGAGVATNFWNPVGWASATFLVADAACLVYAASKL
jgi:hypothetical protein